MRRIVIEEDKSEKRLLDELNKRSDVKAERIKRLLALPDLTKKENSPIKILVDRILDLPRFKDFDLIEMPKIVTVKDEFDTLNSPAEHPTRKETDTFFIDETNHLRTQMTVMWPFYFREEGVLQELEKAGQVMALAPGLVYRKDEIDRKHFPAFHQIDGLLICKKDKKIITLDDLKEVEIEMTKSIFGEDVEYRFLVDSFPFTDPSIQIEIKFNGDWLEVLGSGLVHAQVLKNLGLDPEIYNGWAFGIGIERLAMVKFEIPDIRVFWSNDERITSQFKDINSKFKEVSKFPATIRDISFIINKDVSLNNYYEIVRDYADNLIEEVKLLDEYENEEKFGKDKKSYTFRIVYRSSERTLTNEEINEIQEKIRAKTEKELGALLR
ncbi:MAG: Phenylalanine--tRNA ligase [Patescibacteria group bacterium]|nr:Phenylalanine--tRNA ligase [Patescibacteria group bacterium]